MIRLRHFTAYRKIWLYNECVFIVSFRGDFLSCYKDLKFLLSLAGVLLLLYSVHWYIIISFQQYFADVLCKDSGGFVTCYVCDDYL